ncbi:MAG TPA: hypothetical protein VFC10_18505 [Terriglobia bacterium]|nr:hypothetical protein [Terriglobia bacterium]
MTCRLTLAAEFGAFKPLVRGALREYAAGGRARESLELVFKARVCLDQRPGAFRAVLLLFSNGDEGSGITLRGSTACAGGGRIPGAAGTKSLGELLPRYLWVFLFLKVDTEEKAQGEVGTPAGLGHGAAETAFQFLFRLAPLAF